MEQFHAPLSTMQWVVTGYLLSMTLVLPSFRWAVERVGSRTLYVSCLVAFCATSALSALAWSATSLIMFRVLQGAVGGLLAPLAQTLIAQLAGPKRMGRAVSIISMPVLVAPLLGPTVGGVLVQHLSWRWLFLFNAPVGLIGAWLAYRRLPAGTTTKRTRLDFRGLALLSPGVGLFTYTVTSMGRAHGIFLSTLAPAALAAVLITAFVLDARRRPGTALIDLRCVSRPDGGSGAGHQPAHELQHLRRGSSCTALLPAGARGLGDRRGDAARAAGAGHAPLGAAGGQAHRSLRQRQDRDDWCAADVDRHVRVHPGDGSLVVLAVEHIAGHPRRRTGGHEHPGAGGGVQTHSREEIPNATTARSTSFTGSVRRSARRR